MTPIRIAAASTAIALSIAASIPAATGQPPGKVWHLAVLVADRPGRVETLLDSLAGMNYAQGRNLVVTRLRFESPDELGARAAEAVALKPDVIVAGHGVAAFALKSRTRTIPIVMASSNDAVAQGVIDSLARPGGNVTGLTNMAPVVTAKRLEILKEAVPHATRIAVFGCPDIGSGSKAEWSALQAAAQRVGLAPVPVFMTRGGDLAGTFQKAVGQKVDAVLVLECAFYPSFQSIAAMINDSRLPAMYPAPVWARAGGLMSYGPDGAEQWRRAAVYVDKIFKGARPADLPVEQPTKFELVVNLNAARSLARPIPSSILQRATERIE